MQYFLDKNIASKDIHLVYKIHYIISATTYIMMATHIMTHMCTRRTNIGISNVRGCKHIAYTLNKHRIIRFDVD